MTEEIAFTVYMKVGESPTPAVYDEVCALPLTDDAIRTLMGEDNDGGNHTANITRRPDPYTCYFLNPSSSVEAKFFVGVKHQVVETVEPSDANDITPPEQHIPRDVIDYSMSLYTTFCAFWNDDTDDWNYDGCQPGPLTTLATAHCRCTHLTTFTSGFTVPMNTINLDDSAFLKLNENPVIFAVMVAILCMYLTLLIWARKNDKLDILKAGVTPLADNDPRHRILYEIKILTGSRKDSGTTSKVSLILAGDKGETFPRLLADEKRPVLQRSGCDTFVMAVPRTLGTLSHIRIWHDNSGSNPSWYFSRMVVTDLQTDHKYYFMANRWLAVAEEDGQIDVIIPVAGKGELTSFNTLFWSNTKKNLYDGHIWFSVLNRPASSSFSRVQRLTCCLCLLFTSMLASIAWYKTNENSASQVFRFGPITFSLTGIYVGFISSMMAFPASLLVVCLFRYSRPKPLKKRGFKIEPTKQIPLPKPYVAAVSDNDYDKISIISSSMSFDTMSTVGSLPDMNSSYRNPITPYPPSTPIALDPVMPSYPSVIPQRSNPTTEETSDTIIITEDKPKKKKKKKRFALPHFCVYIAYMFAFACIAVSFWATVEFGGVFGREKSIEWLISFCTSIIESVFLSQPIKVILLAVFYALLCKKPDTEEETSPQLEQDEEWLHDRLNQSDLKHADNVKMLQRLRESVPKPLNNDYLQSAREERLKEKQMWAIIRELTLYMIFMCLLMLVGYGNRHPWSYDTLRHYQHLLRSQKYALAGEWPAKHTFATIKSRAQMFNWLEHIMLPTLYLPLAPTPFITDQMSVLLATVRLRQVRMPTVACPEETSRVIADCIEYYDIWSEDENSYGAYWTPLAINGTGDPHFAYNPYTVLGTFPYWGKFGLYSGGGYYADLGSTYTNAVAVVKRLKQTLWMDDHTRAVFVEFALFNVNTHLWSVSLMLVEFEPHGGAAPNFRMHVIGLDRYVGSFMVALIVSEILTLVFIVVFTVRQIMAVREQRSQYFKNMWNWLELLILFLCYTAIVILLYRILLAYQTGEKIKADRTKFVGFHYAVFWDEIYGYLVGFIVFSSTLKITRLLRFNKKLSFLGSTLRHVSGPILSFMPAIAVVFCGFATLGYLAFGRTTRKFRSFMATSGSLLQMILTAFERRNFSAVMQSVGSMFFATFTLVMNYIVLNLFITILINSFKVVREDLSQQANDYELMDFITEKLKCWFNATVKVSGLFDTGQVKTRASAAVYVEAESEDEEILNELEEKIEQMVDKIEVILESDIRDDLDDIIEQRRQRCKVVYNE